MPSRNIARPTACKYLVSILFTLALLLPARADAKGGALESGAGQAAGSLGAVAALGTLVAIPYYSLTVGEEYEEYPALDGFLLGCSAVTLVTGTVLLSTAHLVEDEGADTAFYGIGGALAGLGLIGTTLGLIVVAKPNSPPSTAGMSEGGATASALYFQTGLSF